MKRRDIIKAAAIGGSLGGLTTVGACSGITRNSTRDTVMRTHKGYLDGPFGQIHYYQRGQGPTLILSHQSPVCARMFERALPELSRLGLRAVAVDTPGYGNSDIPSSPPSIAEYAEMFPAILDGLGLQSAHFLGHHTGAALISSFAAKHPERVDSLILNGPPLLSAKDLEAFADVKPEPPAIHADGSHLQKHWDTRVRYSAGWTDKVAMHRRLVDQLWAGPTAWYGHAAAFKYDMQPDFMALRPRTLILTNTGDDIYHLALKARELRPDMSFAELEGGCHDIVDEQPEAWAAAVARFVLA